MADGLPNWNVTSVIPETDFQQGRGPIEGARVNFITDTGLSSSVFVANTELNNTDKVREIITARLAALNTLYNMTG